MEAQLPKKIKRPDDNFPDLPALPEIFQNLLPTPMPQITYQPGIMPLFSNWVYNRKLRQIMRAEEMKANIAEYKVRQGQAQLQAVFDFLLSGDRYRAALKEIEHRREMMDIEEQKGRQELMRLQMENQIRYWQAQQEEIDYKVKRKNFKEMENGNGASEDQDRIDQ